MSDFLQDSPDGNETSPATIVVPEQYLDTFLMTSTNLDEVLILLTFFRLHLVIDGRAIVDEDTIISDRTLNEALGTSSSSQTSTSRILRGLNRTVRRGALVRQWVEDGARQITRYAAPEQLPDIPAVRTQQSPAEVVEHQGSKPDAGMAPSVYAAYEDNIGMLTPLVADQIQLAIELYPATWIHDAIQEAVVYNKRQWRYIHRVLQNWSIEGRAGRQTKEVNNETNQRGPAEPLDTDQYGEGRHLERARKLQL